MRNVGLWRLGKHTRQVCETRSHSLTLAQSLLKACSKLAQSLLKACLEPRGGNAGLGKHALSVRNLLRACSKLAQNLAQNLAQSLPGAQRRQSSSAPSPSRGGLIDPTTHRAPLPICLASRCTRRHPPPQHPRPKHPRPQHPRPQHPPPPSARCHLRLHRHTRRRQSTRNAPRYHRLGCARAAAMA